VTAITATETGSALRLCPLAEQTRNRDHDSTSGLQRIVLID